ncbi:single-stranded DNA-binding protein [Anaerovorax odorimutans]|uniref:single-stranded DNA-binding protein n=1 Tax=Anaerovorax odorimutans TaxID=109327 RepID=UPI00041CCE91|nr:single-stranded DNA-binding protein [Anaerovorax odorimutans]
METNKAELTGEVLSSPVFSHKSYGEVFYSFLMGINRKSGYRDCIQIVVSERLIWNITFDVGSNIKIEGQIRTYNEVEEGKNKLNIIVFVREFSLIEESEFTHVNKICLEGFICKKPINRMSPLGREICDIMLAVNRMYNKSDYIPCIAWGRNAGYAAGLEVGTKITVEGRIQSREYRKKDEDENVIIKTAYEVSILKIEE